MAQKNPAYNRANFILLVCPITETGLLWVMPWACAAACTTILEPFLSRI